VWSTVRAAREFDRVRDLPVAGGVEDRVDTVRGDGPHAFEEPLAIGDRD
jgi:hypothetical protein